MSELFPRFRFFSDSLGQGAFEPTAEACPCCGEHRAYRYTSSIHARESVDNLCPWCIADGSAAAKYEGTFIDDWALEDVRDEDRLELTCRTPGIITWQTEEWPVHCGQPCAFLAYVGTTEIKALGVDVVEDVAAQADAYGMTVKEFQEALFNKGSLQGYLFQCLACGRHRLTTDCD